MAKFYLASQQVGSSYAAEFIGKSISARQRNGHTARIALPTGTTSMPVYQQMVQMCKAGGLCLHQKVSTYSLDAYVGVADWETEQCWNFMQRHLLGPACVPLAARHYPNPTHPEAYDNLVQWSGAGLDLTLLGIGADGHIGSNMPGSAFDSGTRIVELSQQTRKDKARFFGGKIGAVPKKAVTMGLGTICDLSAKILLLAFGAQKAEAIRRAFQEPPSIDCPASALQQAHVTNRVTVIVGDGAESELTKIRLQELP